MRLYKNLFILLMIAVVVACARRESDDTPGADTPLDAGGTQGPGGNNVATLARYKFYNQHLPNGGTHLFQFIAVSATKYRIFVYGTQDSALKVDPLNAQQNFITRCEIHNVMRGMQVCFSSVAVQNTAYQIKISELTGLSQDYVIAVAEYDGDRGEGSLTSPVPLTLGTPRDGTLVSAKGALGTSYYTFTTDLAGTYKVVISDDTPPISSASFLFKNSDFSSTVNFINPGEYLLPASTTYYLLLQGSNASSWYHRYKLSIISN